MSIRAKIVLVVLPLIVTTLLLTGLSSFLSATNAITGVAKEFLDFKASEMQKYADSQWRLLVENNFTERPAMVAATQAAVESYARSIVRSPTERIFALDDEGRVVMSTGPVEILAGERPGLVALVGSRSEDLVTPALIRLPEWLALVGLPSEGSDSRAARIGGIDRVLKGFYFEPFGWYVVVSEQRGAFYSRVEEITQRTLVILGTAIAVGLVMVLIFARYLTRPLTRVVGTMEDIISTNDLSSRVAVEYQDETGKLAHTFNLMVANLEKLQKGIKHHAFEAVVAKKREHRILTTFEKYVPADVVNTVYENLEPTLVGESRVIAILFSDIRGFTTISEQTPSEELVESLNRYFTPMVDAIMDNEGVIDKYIGDAIMAFFGAPVKHENDALLAVRSGIRMNEELVTFNERQRAIGRPEFQQGVGINYGVATVGNMGTDKKMNYTIIGDMVNLASRIEGLTKEYRQSLLFSESAYRKVKEHLPCRLIDSVAVKGKKTGVKIYTAKENLDDNERQAWTLHNTAMKHYFARDFRQAISHFRGVLERFPGDYVAEIMLEQCRGFLVSPPPEDWGGVRIMTRK